MKKLMLSLDDLRVDTFSTTTGTQQRQGTVQANEATFDCEPASWGATNCSCSDVYETCAQMGCPLSYQTDCHRC